MKRLDRKTIGIILFIGFILTIIGILLIVFLREKLAELILPDVMKKIYMDYKLSSDGIDVPVNIEYLTNNGKLFAFCQAFSSVFVAIVLYKIIVEFGIKLYEKLDKYSVQKIIKTLELSVLVFGVFTFTSKVNPDRNIGRYVIKYSNSTHHDSNMGEKSKIIGYIKLVDLECGDSSVAVYESPQIESAPTYDKDYIGRFWINCIRNIDNISTYSEMVTIILGMYIMVLNNFQKRENILK